MGIRETIPKWTLALSIVAALLHGVTMLRLVDMRVPPYTIRGNPVRLECHYDLEGEALYSVKWFKDDKEFFRFYPEDDPPAQTFPVSGLVVDLPNSSDTAVVLKTVDYSGSGDYKCEVSAEAPSFKTLNMAKTMIVVDLPDASGPQIEGVRPRYSIGDAMRANCTSSRSRPAAKLAWYINQEPADDSFLRHYPIMQDENGYQTSMLGLEFKVRAKHFKKGDLKVKCLATIDTLYWRSNEESAEGDRPQKAPVLESRETFPGKREASTGSSSFKLSSTFCGLLSLSLLVNLSLWLYHNDVLTSILISLFDKIHSQKPNQQHQNWLQSAVSQDEKRVSNFASNNPLLTSSLAACPTSSYKGKQKSVFPCATTHTTTSPVSTSDKLSSSFSLVLAISSLNFRSNMTEETKSVLSLANKSVEERYNSCSRGKESLVVT